MSSHESVLWVLLPSIVGAILLAALFLPQWPMRAVKAPVPATLAYLAQKLWRDGHRVEVAPDHLKVRLDSFSAVRIWTLTRGDATTLLLQADATPRGWSLTMFLFFLGLALSGPVGVAATLTVVALFLRALVFSRKLLRMIRRDGALPDVPLFKDVEAVLLEATAEAHRLAAEAYEAHRSSYWDAQAIAILGALFAWALALVVIVEAGPWWIQRPLELGAIATTVSVAFGIPATYMVWRRYRDRLREFRLWADRLKGAWLRQAAGVSPAESEQSTIEMLGEASSLVPSWVDASRRAGFLEAPHAEFVPFVMGLWGGLLAFGGTLMIITMSVLGVAFLLGGIGLAGAALAIYRSWQRAQDEAAKRLLSDWRRRHDAVQSRMEQFLQDL